MVANADIDLRVMGGEIHALLGENGAGKSTLVKMMVGLLRPDSGTIAWDGRPVGIDGPHAARRLGIGMVHQHFSLFERMTVLENVALGLDGVPADAALAERIRSVGAAHRLPLDPARPVWALSVGERQLIEIVRCLLQEPRLLIMDEPTSVLTPQEVERLFAVVRRVAAEGCAVLYISHKLGEIRSLCHRATVLRAGRVVGECDPAAETQAGLARMMIGAAPALPAREAGTPGMVRLAVRLRNVPAASLHGTALRDVSLDVRAGEIVGVAGVAGNGQPELFAALSGERPGPANSVLVDRQEAGGLGPAGRRALGLCTLPEERNGHAAVPGFSLAENAMLTGRSRVRLARRGMLRLGAAAAFARRVIAGFGVRATGETALAGSLSGGNLQKFVVGREVLQVPDVLVVAQPTWGVDAGAAAAIHAALFALAAAGSAVLVISQDLDELRAISDRLAVIAGGVLTQARPTATMQTERIGLLMAGGYRPMRLERRVSAPGWLAWVTPAVSVGCTLAAAAALFAALGKPPGATLRAIFLEPLLSVQGLSELGLKASPLLLIAVGLAAGFRAGVWNVGAEGQLTMGAIAGGGMALAFDGHAWVLPLMVAAGVLGGMAWAAIPAVLRVRAGVSEILVSLMLTYVAGLFLQWLVLGPWKDPDGMNFPQSRMFTDAATLPMLVEGTRLNVGIVAALAVAAVAAFVMRRTVAGLQIRTVGEAPAAARYAGFSEARVVWGTLLASGGAGGSGGRVRGGGSNRPTDPALDAGLWVHRHRGGVPGPAAAVGDRAGGRPHRAVLHRWRQRTGGAGSPKRGGGTGAGDAAVLPVGVRRPAAVSGALCLRRCWPR